jgi:hypothetical protein
VKWIDESRNDGDGFEDEIEGELYRRDYLFADLDGIRIGILLWELLRIVTLKMRTTSLSDSVNLTPCKVGGTSFVSMKIGRP